MKTLSKSKGVKENICTDATHIVPPHEDWKAGFYRHTCFGCGKTSHFQVKEVVNEMPPTLLDDDIADWEHDNLESK